MKDQRRRRRKATQFEEEIADLIPGAWTTSGSGNKAHDKGDVINDELIFECKTTGKQSYRLNLSIWDKLRDEARVRQNRIPVFAVEIFGNIPIVFLDENDYHNRLVWTGRLDVNSTIPQPGLRRSVKVTPYLIDLVKSSGSLRVITTTSTTFRILPLETFARIYKEKLEQRNAKNH